MVKVLLPPHHGRCSRGQSATQAPARPPMRLSPLPPQHHPPPAHRLRRHHHRSGPQRPAAHAARHPRDQLLDDQDHKDDRGGEEGPPDPLRRDKRSAAAEGLEELPLRRAGAVRVGVGVPPGTGVAPQARHQGRVRLAGSCGCAVAGAQLEAAFLGGLAAPTRVLLEAQEAPQAVGAADGDEQAGEGEAAVEDAGVAGVWGLR